MILLRQSVVNYFVILTHLYILIIITYCGQGKLSLELIQSVNSSLALRSKLSVLYVVNVLEISLELN